MLTPPIITPIKYLDPLKYAAILKSNHFVFFDSAKFHSHFGRYSFIAFSPFATLEYKNGLIFYDDILIPSIDIFEFLSKKIFQFKTEKNLHLPPFQGGIAGYLSYDLARVIEKLPSYSKNEHQYSDLALGFYDLVLSFDHLIQKAWLISSGFPELNKHKRLDRANYRSQWALAQLGNINQAITFNDVVIEEQAIQSNFNKNAYILAVKKVIDYILAGDIFEANLSQRFQCQLPQNFLPFDLYQKIRCFNPSPFSGYAVFGDTYIVSSSPERFLKLENKKVETRPIKGTCRRSPNPLEDERLALKLEKSNKNRAENTMIVDLMRNDLSKLCLPHSIQVPQYCGIESYETVHHLVSVVEGLIKDEYNAIDLLKATFPGGSITGAPKIRSMEIIEELEPTQRGPYCGSLGYIGFDGTMDTSILIRSFVIKDNLISFQAGGAITLCSDPEQEYEETLTKAQALKRALTVLLPIAQGNVPLTV